MQDFFFKGCTYFISFGYCNRFVQFLAWSWALKQDQIRRAKALLQVVYYNLLSSFEDTKTQVDG